MNKRISVVIPCRNEEMYIGKCLESVINCAYPNDYKEILICDGISTDNTCRIVATYEKKYPFIKLLINAKQTAPYAMNLGIEVSSGDIIVIMGAHTELLPDYIEECIKAFAINPAIGCVGGIVENIPVNSTSEIISKAMSSSFGVGNARFRTGKTGDCYVDTLGPGAYKREVFEKVGLIDVELTRNQDDEFNFRLRKNGYLIYLFGKTVAKYFVRASFSKLYRQYFQYGYWKVYVNKKHKTITTLRQLAPFFFVVFLILGLFASFIHSYIAYTYLSIISIYILSAFFAASAKSGKISSILKIVYTFIILHISYGLGYLEGFIVFFIFKHGPSNRNKKLTR